MNIEEKKRPHTEVAKKDENLHLLMIIFLIYYLGFCFTIDLYVHIQPTNHHRFPLPWKDEKNVYDYFCNFSLCIL